MSTTGKTGTARVRELQKQLRSEERQVKRLALALDKAKIRRDRTIAKLAKAYGYGGGNRG